MNNTAKPKTRQQQKKNYNINKKCHFIKQQQERELDA